MIFGDNQVTILIHVHDLIITCKDQSGIYYVITCLNNEYTKENMYDGETLKYLGMNPNPGEISISIGNFVGEFLVEVGVGNHARAESPAANYLYQVDDKGELLNQSDKEYLHSMVSKALHMAKRGQIF